MLEGVMYALSCPTRTSAGDAEAPKSFRRTLMTPGALKAHCLNHTPANTRFITGYDSLAALILTAHDRIN